MKKIFYTIVLIAVVLSCTGKRQSGDANGANALTFDTIRVLEKIKLLEYGIDTLPRTHGRAAAKRTGLSAASVVFRPVLAL